MEEKKSQSLKNEIINSAKYANFTNDNWLVNVFDLEFTEKLGSGSYAKVYRGLCKGLEVAIKVLKKNAQEEFHDFVKEFEIMRYFCLFFRTKYF